MPDRRTLEDPVEGAARAWREASVPSERLDAIVLALELAIRTDALILGAAFLRDGQRRDARARSLFQMRRLVLGQWWELLWSLVATTPDSSPCRPIARFYREDAHHGDKSLVARLLRTRNPRAHDLGRISGRFVSLALAGSETLLESFLSARPATPALLADVAGSLWADLADGPLHLCPLMLPECDGRSVSSPLLFSGWSAAGVLYESLHGDKLASPERDRELRVLLESKVGSTEIIDASASPALLASRAQEVSRTTIGRLIALKRYRPGVVVHRAEVDEALAHFGRSDKPLLLLEGPAGAGKTTCLASWVDRVFGSTSTVFESIDRLGPGAFPDVLASCLRLKGDAAAALQKIASLSADGRVWVVLDDVSASGQDEQTLLSLVSWAECLDPAGPVRVVASLRSDRLRSFLSVHSESFPAHLVHRVPLPPFAPGELLDLAGLLPFPEGAEAEATLQARQSVAVRLSQVGVASLRRPGLAVPLLESSLAADIPGHLSAVAVYQRMLSGLVLEAGEDGLPRRPGVGRLARQLAATLLRLEIQRLPLEGDDSARLRVLDPATGKRTPEYEALLADEVLVEHYEEFESWVAFSDPRFFEFLAATSIARSEAAAALRRLVASANKYPSAQSVAAFFCCLSAASPDGLSTVVGALKSIGGAARGMLLETASLDHVSAATLLIGALGAQSDDVAEVLDALIMQGEARLAADVTRRFILILPETELTSSLHFLQARACYEIDDYGAAESALALVPEGSFDPAYVALKAEIATSRGDFRSALDAYEGLLARSGSPLSRAQALRGAGYALSQLADAKRAESYLREAIALFGDAPSVPLAEAWGDLGELLASKDDFDGARDAYERSHDLNRGIPSLNGIGITLGLLGVLESRRGDVEKAQALLEESLTISRRVGNRWREAWTVEHLARCSESVGASQEARALRSRADDIRSQLVGDPAVIASGARTPAGDTASQDVSN